MAPVTDPVHKILIYGRAKYKGGTYYIRWQGITKTRENMFLLVTRNAEYQVWAKAELVEVVKMYDPQRPFTLADIQDFVAQQQSTHSVKSRTLSSPPSASVDKVCWNCSLQFNESYAIKNRGDWDGGWCGC
jgi:hypothetical protein